MINQLEQVLAQHGWKEIEVLGRQFDPAIHEAAGQIHNEEFDSGTVCHVIDRGYQMYDRVIRPAGVIVSAGSQS